MPVKGLIHYALEVPGPVVGETFYRDFGLKETDSRGNSLKLQTSRGSGELLLFEGPKKRLHHIAFAAPGDDFEAVRAALKQAGIPELDPPKDAPQVGIWIHDSDGNLINIRQEERKTIPTEPLLNYNGPGNASRIGARGLPTFERADPRRRSGRTSAVLGACTGLRLRVVAHAGRASCAPGPPAWRGAARGSGCRHGDARDL
jgi:catechol 2,3-dioxygenase-like lactoylglutathione lyase family enzyme